MADILLVDDHPAIRHAITSYLESLGHTVTTAPAARPALELAGPKTDLVVTDLATPGVDGVVLIQALRERNIFAPMILVSEHFPRPDEHAEAAFVLLKPFAPEDLGRAIDKALVAREQDIRAS